MTLIIIFPIMYLMMSVKLDSTLSLLTVCMIVDNNDFIVIFGIIVKMMQCHTKMHIVAH